MAWPLSQDYNEAIQSPALCFADPELKQGEAACNALGLPMPRSGNFADVYEFKTPKQKWAVKCFTREIPGLRERYKEISAYLRQMPLPFMVDFSYLEQGIRVRNDWYPILKMHWVDGFTLNDFVKQQLDKPQILDMLCQLWVKLAGRLREGNLAHCDLQHGNVLLVPGSKAASLAVKLVDYDGMCVPSLTLLKTIEVGHPNFQHPQRAREGIYSLEVDRFSHLVIYTALRALISGGRDLWQKYDNGDNLLFKQVDLETPTRSPLFAELVRSTDPGIRILAETMMQALAKPLGQTPLLPDLAAKLPAPGAVITKSGATSTAESLFAAATTSDSGPRRKSQLPRRGGMPAWAWAAGLAAILAVAGGAVFLALGNKEQNKERVVQKNPEEPKKKTAEIEKDKLLPKDKAKTQPTDKDKTKQPLPKEEDWLKSVAAMKVEDQVQAVAGKLKELNPGFDGKVDHRIENDVVISLSFNSEGVSDISPVRALKGLKVLGCGSSGKSNLADLSPLKGLLLEELNCQNTAVSDLSPLKGMPLKLLNCPSTKVTDLSPLRELPLKQLGCDLDPQRDADLLRSIKTLVAINGKPVDEFWKEFGVAAKPGAIPDTQVDDSGIENLKGMKSLEVLGLSGTKIGDSALDHLQNLLGLKSLFCIGTGVTDAGVEKLQKALPKCRIAH